MPAKTLPLRGEVPQHLTWDLSTVYACEEDWEADFQRASGYPEKLTAYRGRMRRSGRLLLAALHLSEECSQLAGRLHLYARLRSDEDTANSTYKAMVDRCVALSSNIDAARSFMTPGILSIKPEQLEAFIARTAGLELYRHDFDQIAGQREHVRSPEVEELLSTAGEIRGGPSSIFGQLNNADLKLPVVKSDEDHEVQLSQGLYGRLIESTNRHVRSAAFEGMMSTYNELRNTFAASYAAQVKMDIFRARARRYPSALTMALSNINVPRSVYDTLIETVHANLPLLQRYLELRKRILELDELHMYDLYVPIVGGVETDIDYQEAQQTVLAAVSPLGDHYASTLRSGYQSRWIDVVENKGKRSGAYSSGVWGTNPFMLLNWQGNVDSMFTLAHESGHSMHSFYSRSTQPYTYSGYTPFVAEVASTTNEALLARYLLQHTTDSRMRLYVLNKQLEGIRTTLIRQTLFAEFEQEAHARAEAGQALTPEVLCDIHRGLNQTYYGPAVTVDGSNAIEWARIPHFYRAFYVYQYATGISAATALAHQIVTEGQPAVKRYVNFLKSGSSDYSINVLRKAGVDLSTPVPIQQAFDAFAEYLRLFEEEFERLREPN